MMPGLTIVVPVQLLKAASNGAFHGNTLQLLASLVTLQQHGRNLFLQTNAQRSTYTEAMEARCLDMSEKLT